MIVLYVILAFLKYFHKNKSSKLLYMEHKHNSDRKLHLSYAPYE